MRRCGIDQIFKENVTSMKQTKYEKKEIYADKNGGGGVFIKLPDSRSIRKSVATGQQSTNYRACSSPDSEPRRETSYQHSFLTDCRSILQSLQSPGGDQIFSSIRQELSLLKNKTSVTLQWIPSHCGVGGNEEADRLSNM